MIRHDPLDMRPDPEPSLELQLGRVVQIVELLALFPRIDAIGYLSALAGEARDRSGPVAAEIQRRVAAALPRLR